MIEMATMKDVAKLAGVSVGTVSNVLNGRSVVSEKRQKLVRDAIEQLGFYQNQAAKTLRTGITNTIGLIIPDIDNPYYPQIARGVEDCASEYNYNVLICNSDRIAGVEKNCMEKLLARGVDGVIDVKPALPQETLFGFADACPIVLIDSYYNEQKNVSCINIDFHDDLLKVYQQAFDMGHSRFAYIGGGLTSLNDLKRFETFNEFVRNNGFQENQVQVFMGPFTGEFGSMIASRMINSNVLPTIIFCASDIIAIGVLDSLTRNGIRVPEDISVVGFDNIWASAVTRPRLTTIDVPKHDLGYLAAKKLFGKLLNEETDCTSSALTVSLLLRETFSRPKAAGSVE